MKALYLPTQGGPDSLVLGELPVPVPGPREVLVKVHATALTPTEFRWAPTFTSRSNQPRPFPIVLGHEFSGVIAAIGPDVTEWEVGAAVYGLNDWFTNGAQAEYCVARATHIAFKPRTIDHGQAAAAPISALTAWQALVVRSRLRAGQRILIHGAAGAVGLFAVQIARECGARVFATAAARHHELLRSLGADEVIDHTTVRFEAVARDLDVIFDPVGGDTLERPPAVLRRGGVLVTIAATSEARKDRRTQKAFMLVEADRIQLEALSDAIDTGRRRVFVAGEFPFERAAEAYVQAAGSGHGKTVLRVVPAATAAGNDGSSASTQVSTSPDHAHALRT